MRCRICNKICKSVFYPGVSSEGRGCLRSEVSVEDSSLAAEKKSGVTETGVDVRGGCYAMCEVTSAGTRPFVYQCVKGT